MIAENLLPTRKEARQQKSILYYTGRRCLNNHVAPRYATTGQCYACVREWSITWRKKNPTAGAESARRYARKNKTRIDAYQLKRRRENPELMMLHRARNRAKTLGLEFNLILDDVQIPERCPVFGVPLVSGAYSPRYPWLPSLDRIDNSKGYVKSNVCVISNRANSLKNDATLDELRAIKSYVSCSRGDE